MIPKQQIQPVAGQPVKGGPIVPGGANDPRLQNPSAYNAGMNQMGGMQAQPQPLPAGNFFGGIFGNMMPPPPPAWAQHPGQRGGMGGRIGGQQQGSTNPQTGLPWGVSPGGRMNNGWYQPPMPQAPNGMAQSMVMPNPVWMGSGPPPFQNTLPLDGVGGDVGSTWQGMSPYGRGFMGGGAQAGEPPRGMGPGYGAPANGWERQMIPQQGFGGYGNMRGGFGGGYGGGFGGFGGMGRGYGGFGGMQQGRPQFSNIADLLGGQMRFF